MAENDPITTEGESLSFFKEEVAELAQICIEQLKQIIDSINDRGSLQDGFHLKSDTLEVVNHLQNIGAKFGFFHKPEEAVDTNDWSSAPTYVTTRLLRHIITQMENHPDSPQIIETNLHYRR